MFGITRMSNYMAHPLIVAKRERQKSSDHHHGTKSFHSSLVGQPENDLFVKSLPNTKQYILSNENPFNTQDNKKTHSLPLSKQMSLFDSAFGKQL
jgi:hypothetical protein